MPEITARRFVLPIESCKGMITFLSDTHGRQFMYMLKT
jgi:hypothetical protein